MYHIVNYLWIFNPVRVVSLFDDAKLVGDRPDDGCSKHLRKVGELLPYYTEQQLTGFPRRMKSILKEYC
jgi:hypothetical protein